MNQLEYDQMAIPRTLLWLAREFIKQIAAEIRQLRHLR